MDYNNKGFLKTGKRRLLTSHKLGFFLIILGMVWGFYLLRLTAVYERGNHKESEVLKTKIVELSKKYIAALSKEHAAQQIDYPNDGRTHMPEMKKATTLLLQNMLDRIQLLESELHTVIVNSTMEFAKFSMQIYRLNSSMLTKNNISVAEAYTMFWMCEVPIRSNYPECATKVAWLQLNWDKDPQYKQKGVNGSMCSLLEYLSKDENFCPKDFVKKQVYIIPSSKTVKEIPVPNDPAFPECQHKLQWMEQFWKSDPYYAARGVDGSRESFLTFLSEVEDWCPLLPGRKKQKPECVIPNHRSFPQCGAKIAWMKGHWKVDPCYAVYGVNGTICSFIKYLSEIESWCPLFPGRHKRVEPSVSALITEKPNLDQRGIAGLLEKLNDPDHLKFDWIKSRLTVTWPNWLNAIQSLEKKRQLKNYPRKKIMIYIGLLADENVYHFGQQAPSGGPLGELVQWTDLIASIYLLGHDLTVSVDKQKVNSLLSGSVSGFCPNSKPSQFDVIYTDYIGLNHFIRQFQTIDKIRCHIRLVDSFGTEAQFNHLSDPKLTTAFGSHNFNLKQFNTMFPHSPDNTFLGFVVGKKVNPNEVFQKKPIALVYGKHPSMWKDVNKIKFLDTVSEYFQVHATVGKGNGWVSLPAYITNHGVLGRPELLKLLRSAKVFIGMGFPFEGPAPLEAIANGCFFLNAKLDPPLGRENSEFFKSKPTFRKLVSQHPYAERYIGKPHVQTVKLNDKAALVSALKFMKNNTVKPLLPYEYTYEGTLDRIYAFTKNQNFCQQNLWPPLANRKILVGQEGTSCKSTCQQHGLICEPSYFESLNKVDLVKKHMGCKAVDNRASYVAPSKNSNDNTCTLQLDQLMKSCTAESQSVVRLCPCRDFILGQTALCKGCI